MIYRNGLKRTPLRKIGKVGRANQMANQKIKQFCTDHNIQGCEVKLPGCTNIFIFPAHLYSRHYLRSSPDLLSNPDQYVMACEYCHRQLDDNMTQEEKQIEFDRVIASRGKEVYYDREENGL